MKNKSAKDIAFDRERAKFRKEIREKNNTIIYQLSKISDLEAELREANDKIQQQEDWIKRLLEYMDMSEDEMRKRIENDKTKDQIFEHFKDIKNIFGRFGIL